VDHQILLFSDIGVDAVVDEVAVVASNPNVCDPFDVYAVERGRHSNVHFTVRITVPFLLPVQAAAAEASLSDISPLPTME
jgi:hypothetical protein